MTKLMQGLFVSTGLLLASLPGSACAQSHSLQPAVPRTVAISDSGAPPVIHAGLLQATLILLPAEEKVATVFVGDSVNWVIDGGHVASRFISVKPRATGGSTDIHIVSDHGNEYTLQLREVSVDEDSHFDSKVTLSPSDMTSKERITELPLFVPASELDRVKQEAASIKAQADAERKQQDAKTELYRSQYPASLRFDYAWDVNKAKGVGLQQVWRDDKFTYLRGHFQETPALYELKDGKGSLINFDFHDGLYTVPKELDNGYLAIGKQRVEFHRAGERN